MDFDVNKVKEEKEDFAFEEQENGGGKNEQEKEPIALFAEGSRCEGERSETEEPMEFVDVKIEGDDDYDRESAGSSMKSEYPEDPMSLVRVKMEDGDIESDETSCSTEGVRVSPSPSSPGESKEDLAFQVAHFLAETSCRKKQRSRAGKLRCSKCTAVFRYKSTLSYHIKSDCGTKIIVGEELVKKRSSKESVDCDVCKKKLCSRTSLMVHMRIHTGERPFECDHCGRSFFQKAHLRDHVRSLHAPGQFLCRACNATFAERASLDAHLGSHFPPGVFRCQECGKRYASKSSLSSHVSLAHVRTRNGNEKKTLECGTCSAILRSTGQLRRHVRLHRAPRNCPHCPRSFPSAYDLGIHLRSHTGERPFACDSCGRSFARKSTLQMHTTLHTGRKDYNCQRCDKAFNRKSKLDIHMADHLNTTWLCAECNKSFKCKSYLDSHVKTHAKGSNFPCDSCSKSFKSPRGLKYHRRSSCRPEERAPS